VASFLPEGLTAASGRCAVYFAEWQFATETGQEYLDPVGSQYKEAIFLVSAKHEGEPVAYCPFIWVDQDVSLMRGLVQGWPKQIGSVWVSRAYDLPSKASPVVGPSGKFGASLAVKDRRLVDATVTLREQTDAAPSPGFAKAFNVRYFPDLAAGSHDRPTSRQGPTTTLTTRSRSLCSATIRRSSIATGTRSSREEAGLRRAGG
jgi:hypothetical protein